MCLRSIECQADEVTLDGGSQAILWRTRQLLEECQVKPGAGGRSGGKKRRGKNKVEQHGPTTITPTVSVPVPVEGVALDEGLADTASSGVADAMRRPAQSEGAGGARTPEMPLEEAQPHSHPVAAQRRKEAVDKRRSVPDSDLVVVSRSAGIDAGAAGELPFPVVNKSLGGVQVLSNPYEYGVLRGAADVALDGQQQAGDFQAPIVSHRTNAALCWPTGWETVDVGAYCEQQQQQATGGGEGEGMGEDEREGPPPDPALLVPLQRRIVRFSEMRSSLRGRTAGDSGGN